MKEQGIYQATLFAAIAQNNIIGLTFGYWLATGAPKSEPFPAVLVFMFWIGASWWVWLWARKTFWPEDYRGGGQ